MSQSRRVRKPRSTRLALESLGDRVMPATLTVTTTDDTTNTDLANLSLRGAITLANTNADAVNTIILKGGSTYSLTRANTAGQENRNDTGDLDILNATASPKTFTLTTDSGTATINANQIDRVFHVQRGMLAANVTVNFENLIITGGRATDEGAPGDLPGDSEACGGGILNDSDINEGIGFCGGTLYFTNATVVGNIAGGGHMDGPDGGGGDFGESAFGGGLFTDGSSPVTLNASSFIHNRAIAGQGGDAGYIPTTSGHTKAEGATGGLGGDAGGAGSSRRWAESSSRGAHD